MPRVPLTLITGFLGSGKTTLCRHILASVDQKIAFLINEFGEIAIDSRVIQGTNIHMTELAGGCVCCSLIGEFEAAIEEILARATPDLIVVETTGIAEPDALVVGVQENLPGVRLDGVITICDADSMERFPEFGHTARLQIESADLLLLNKVDLVSDQTAQEIKDRISQLNSRAPIVPAVRCRVDTGLLFGARAGDSRTESSHRHQPEFESFSYASGGILNPERFSQFADCLQDQAYRVKGLVRFPEATYLFNFVAGRWEMEPLASDRTSLVFIGPFISRRKDTILAELQKCEYRPS
jgi:G3E family GTPase